jgi:methylenetetrahydrofolate dehydrogenase (NADP+)/methenyltetrahydrofolate cyclohydrolase
MTIVSGKKIQKEIIADLKEKLSRVDVLPILHIVYVGSDSVIESFMRIKKRVGDELGIEVRITRLEESVEQQEVERIVLEVCNGADSRDGVVIQLPLPDHLDRESILGIVPVEMDVDVLSHNAYVRFVGGVSSVIPPVVGAMLEVLHAHDILLQDKNIVVVGQGMLTGRPLVAWLQQKGLPYKVITESTKGREDILRQADILFTATGVPGLITPELIQEGVVLIDAGTSIQSGALAGDVHPDCIEKASVTTPTPGGIGPITVAVLFRNLVIK